MLKDIIFPFRKNATVVMIYVVVAIMLVLNLLFGPSDNNNLFTYAFTTYMTLKAVIMVYLHKTAQ